MAGDRFYITTAISYPNGAPHIGHAYEAVATDAIARFKRLDGADVFFMTGVDEHGLKMTQTAARQGMTPRELSDCNVPLFVAMCDKLNVSYDRFIRTTEPAHYDSVQEIWRRMERAGDIYLGTYAGWYSVRDEAFYDESETRLNTTASAWARRARRLSGRKREPTSSACPPTRTACLRTMRRIPASSAPRRGATRSSASFEAASRISRSRAPP